MVDSRWTFNFTFNFNINCHWLPQISNSIIKTAKMKRHWEAELSVKRVGNLIISVRMIKEINDYNGVLKQISSNHREPNGQKEQGFEGQ